MRIPLTYIMAGSLAAFAPVRLAAQTLQRLSAQGVTRVEVFADGNIKNVISQPSDVTNASGSLGIRYLGRTYIATGLINVAGTFDTVRAGFGATLLAPATGKALNAGLLDVRRRHFFGLGKLCEAMDQDNLPLKCNLGMHVYGSVSSHRWATQVDGDGIPLATADVQVWGSGFGIFYNFFEGTVGDSTDAQPVAMVLDVGLAGRHLRGDLFSRDTLRQRLLNDDKKNFYGLEVGLGIQYQQIKAGLNYYFMNGDVDGLSHGQVVAGVSIQANLNSGPLHHGPPAKPKSAGADQPPAEPADSTTGLPPAPPADSTSGLPRAQPADSTH